MDAYLCWCSDVSPNVGGLLQEVGTRAATEEAMGTQVVLWVGHSHSHKLREGLGGGGKGCSQYGVLSCSHCVGV